MTEQPDAADLLGVYLHDHVDYDDNLGTTIATDVTTVAEYAVDWLRAHPEVAAGLWPNGFEFHMDGKWVSAASHEVVAKIRRLEQERAEAEKAADQVQIECDRRIKALQDEFARQARVYERRIERAQTALDGDAPKETTT
jgi:hypothetical protein